jgi:hypothetical protein
MDKIVKLTDEELKKLHDSNDQIIGYEFSTPTVLRDDEKLSMEEVEDRIGRCRLLGTREKCMADDEIREFATRTHPKIFEAVMENDVKKMRLLQRMIDTKKRVSQRPETEEQEMVDLHLRLMGFDRTARRRMIRKGADRGLIGK